MPVLTSHKKQATNSRHRGRRGKSGKKNAMNEYEEEFLIKRVLKCGNGGYNTSGGGLPILD
jgi:hypothetical protein